MAEPNFPSQKSIQKLVRSSAAIVVSYDPSPVDFIVTIENLKEQFRLVIIVDNSESEVIKSQLETHYVSLSGIKFIPLKKNYGIAKAQNIGINACLKLGFKYFCEFDQDSFIEDEFLFRIVKSYLMLDALNYNHVAAVGPNAVDVTTSIPYRKREYNESPELVETTLSSGLFVPIESYLKIGPKEEELFIDLVDWEWCFRAKSLGMAVYVDPEITLLHKLGSHHQSVVGLFNYGTPAAFRHYYAFRNYIHMTRRSYIPMTWKVKYFILNIGKLITYPFIMDTGFTRFKFMCRGLSDGFNGKTGRL
jgi:rhamnosyltransferase